MTLTPKQRRRAEKKERIRLQRELRRMEPLVEAHALYEQACQWALDYGADQIVCERCGFVQPALHDPQGRELVPCLRGHALDVACPGTIAITVEAYRDTN